MDATKVKERSSKKEEIRVKREWKRLKISAPKVAAKVQNMAENGCERGQPIKTKVGCKILANRTTKRMQAWLQIKRERRQRRVGKKRAKKQGKTE